MVSSYRKVFWAAGFGWMFDAMDVGLLSFIIVQLTKEWGLSPTEGGLLGTATTAGMAIGAVVGGYWADRIGRKPVFLFTLVLFGLASLGSAFSPGLGVMLVFRVLMGLGLGAELPVASTLVNEVAPPEKRGRTVVLLESFWAVGWILAAVIAYFVMPDYGWRAAVLIGALPIVYALYVRRGIPESPKHKAVQSRVPVGTLVTSHGRQTAALWIVWFAVAFSYYGMFLWLPSVMIAKGFTTIRSFEYVLYMTLAQLPGYFAAAYLVERWGRKATLAVFLVMTALMAALFGYSESTALLMTSGALLSFFNLGAWGALYAYTPESYPEEVRASGAGLASGIGRIGSVIAPYLVGYLVMLKLPYAAIFGMFTVVILLGVAGLLIFGRETAVRTKPYEPGAHE
ncbi:MFS transporter [Paenibacillus aurantius]|uniref:MFS transporter n=1 Tax=Paenibacillus aurantius TaxID=2918900 RepID=A0AA96LCE4_9BACL|nr:MFS transporter [Paenibacillus aurantius]WNQ10583.1 MFS transporter [Paenibacillus aurantius]